MSWLNHILPKIQRKQEPQDATQRKVSPIPEGLWTKCPGCEQTLYAEELRGSLQVCPKCGHHMRIGARARLEAFLDPEGQVEVAANVRAEDPLHFVDSKPYPKRREAAEKTTGETDAIVVMSGTLRREPSVAAAVEFKYMGGSGGSVVGGVRDVEWGGR